MSMNSDVLKVLRSLSWAGLLTFLVAVFGIAVAHGRTLFLEPRGWPHRLSGALLLVWLIVGACTCGATSKNVYFAVIYDIILGILGIIATLTAARAFPHKLVQNDEGRSGTLHKKAIVTQGEMIEHSFYQGLNLMQAIYLHLMHHFNSQSQLQDTQRLVLLFIMTSPWLVRDKLPVHSFSGNWENMSRSYRRASEAGKGLMDVEIILYMIKKGQYLFYKHVILHGLNIYMAISSGHLVGSSESPPYSLSWRIFWVLLNGSYVMEFFLQSLVKRRSILKQSTMLWMQRWLIASSSLGAIVVLVKATGHGIWNYSSYLLPAASVASLILNFTNRHHDTFNTMIIASMLTFISR